MSGEGIRSSGRPPGELARRWLVVIDGTEERLKGRIRRGRTLARSGRVQALDIAPGTVYADVEDNGEVHRPTLRIRAYEEDEWSQVIALLGKRLDRLAALMEGEVGEDFLEALEGAGLDLFPQRDEIDSDCDCGDYALPCAHGAAVHYLLAEALEGDPMQLLALRGRPREQLIAEFRRRWGDKSVAPSGGGAAREEVAPSGDWFASPVPLQAMAFRFSAEVTAPGLVELGPLPGDGDLIKTFGPLYDAGADVAREMALAERADDGRPRRPRPAAASVVTVVETVPAVAPEPEPTPEPSLRAESDLGERLVDLLAEADTGVSTRYLADRVGMESLRVRRELLELEELGVVARTGSTRATRWWLG